MTPQKRLVVLNDAHQFLSIRFNYHKSYRISKFCRTRYAIYFRKSVAKRLDAQQQTSFSGDVIFFIELCIVILINTSMPYEKKESDILSAFLLPQSLLPGEGR